MKILLTTALWGVKNRSLFANHSVTSLLAPGNIPALARRHQVTCLVVTTREDLIALWAHPAIVRLAWTCQLVMVCMEDYGLDPATAPNPSDQKKYEFVTKLQNIAIRRSLLHDAIVFNYADFVWADGSLPNAVELLGSNDAVLSFCLPVDLNRGAAELRKCGPALEPRKMADLCLSHLHAEATYRYWDAREFTNLPSYLLFRVDDEGVVIRAFHQTALVMRVKKDDEKFFRGISTGTLDGSFTGELARRGPVVHADDSDRVMVISLHDGTPQSHRRSADRDESLAFFLAHHCDPQQRRFAERPLRVRRALNDEAAWNGVEQDSGDLLAAL